MARYSPEHKEETRKKLLEVSRRLFREEGFEAASIDRLMKAAGLTRGGFYAHFESKEALVEEVLSQDAGLLVHLREAKSPMEAAALFDDYLSEGERPGRIQCPLVAHPIDSVRGGETRRALYAGQVEGLKAGLGLHVDGDDATLLSIVAVGAAILSSVVPNERDAADIERVARDAIRAGLGAVAPRKSAGET